MENINEFLGGISKEDKKNERFERKEIDFSLEREWNEQEKAAIKIIEKLQKAGHETYFAGGAVRDYVKGKKPNDIDICTSASSNEVERIFENDPGSSVYYKSEKAQENKIINVKTDGFEFEIASFRKDVFLSYDISAKLKSIEVAGYGKRLMEYDNEYEEFLNGLKDGEEVELLNEESMRDILPDCVSIYPANKKGVYSIVDGDRKYDLLFYKITGNNENADNAGVETERKNEDGAGTEKKQKQVSGRHPDLTVTRGVNLEEDARRRDFTMNGLFYDPKRGKIIDCVGGYEDVINKKIKFIGDPLERIREDKIRILRFFRFKGVMDLEADANSIDAIRNWFASEERKKEFMNMFYLNQRIRPELEKTLKSDNTSTILDDMMNEGVLELIMPEIARMKGVDQPKEHHQEGDVWEHTKNCLDKLISYDEYRKKYPEYDAGRIEREYMNIPRHDQGMLLPFEEYEKECNRKNMKANDILYNRIKEKWNGKMPSKEEYVREFIQKRPEEIESEYLELAWSVLLHDSGKAELWSLAKKSGSEELNFHKHEKASAEISKFVLYMEKEAKKGRLKDLNLDGEKFRGLNLKGERPKGLNYELNFAGNIVWLVSNHMHHLDFSRMSRTKQEQLMDNNNFDKLLELWKADVMGSEPVKMEKLEEAMEIYEKYKKMRKEKNNEGKREDVIKPDELMEILKSENIEMRGGLAKIGNFSFSRAIPVLVEHLNDLFPERNEKGTEKARERIRSMVNKERMFDKILKNIEDDLQVKKLKEDINNISGKKKNTQARKIDSAISKRANEIFESYFTGNL